MAHLQQLSYWLKNLKTAWEKKDYKILERILADKIEYHESPFQPPLTSKGQIINQWKKDLAKQKDIKFDFQIIHTWENECIANWQAAFIRTDTSVKAELNGIFHIKLNRNSACTYFKQWWVVK